MNCKLCELPASALGLCKKHYRADLRARYRDGKPIRPYAQPTYFDQLKEFLQKELGK